MERKPEITLKHIHKLKLIKRGRQNALRSREQLASIMYSDPDHQIDDAKFNLEMTKQEMELDIEKAELMNDQKAEISKKAFAAVQNGIQNI